jgi:phage-related protein
MSLDFDFWDCGKNSPCKFYKSLDNNAKARLDKEQDKISRNGFFQCMKDNSVEKVKECKEPIYEVKVKCRDKRELRLLSYPTEFLIYYLVIFWKKDQKIRRKYIKLAVQRYKKLI